MDGYNPNRMRNRKTLSSTELFLGVPPQAPPLDNRTSSTADEFIEDDVVFSDYDYTEPSSSSSAIPTPNPNHNNNNNNNHHNNNQPHRNHSHHQHNHNHKGSPFGDSFGILAALPENNASPNSGNGSRFLKAPVSVSLSASLSSSLSSSSSRPILAIPRPPSYRTPSSSWTSIRYHQSAPVSVPPISPAMIKAARKFEQEEAERIAEEEAARTVMPPHEFVLKKSELSPMLSCSVLEGFGRTLKGRDLRQVRNAVLRQTGLREWG